MAYSPAFISFPAWRFGLGVAETRGVCLLFFFAVLLFAVHGCAWIGGGGFCGDGLVLLRIGCWAGEVCCYWFGAELEFELGLGLLSTGGYLLGSVLSYPEYICVWYGIRVSIMLSLCYNIHGYWGYWSLRVILKIFVRDRLAHNTILIFYTEFDDSHKI